MLRKFLKDIFEQEKAKALSPDEVRLAFLEECAARRLKENDKKIFPYQRIYLHVRLPDEVHRTDFEVAFADLESKLSTFLTQKGCEKPSGVQVEVSFVSNEEVTSAKGYAAQFKKIVREISKAVVVISAGQTSQPEYQLTKDRHKVGRSDNPTIGGMPEQNNDIAFLDIEDRINQSVSRVHAHFERSKEQNTYILFDDGSLNKTTVFRDGVKYEIRPPKGLSLQNGDILCFGDARATFAIECAEKEVS